jgi:hypothetical protein
MRIELNREEVERAITDYIAKRTTLDVALITFDVNVVVYGATVFLKDITEPQKTPFPTHESYPEMYGR